MEILKRKQTMLSSTEADYANKLNQVENELKEKVTAKKKTNEKLQVCDLNCLSNVGLFNLLQNICNVVIPLIKTQSKNNIKRVKKELEMSACKQRNVVLLPDAISFGWC